MYYFICNMLYITYNILYDITVIGQYTSIFVILSQMTRFFKKVFFNICRAMFSYAERDSHIP